VNVPKLKKRKVNSNFRKPFGNLRVRGRIIGSPVARCLFFFYLFGGHERRWLASTDKSKILLMLESETKTEMLENLSPAEGSPRLETLAPLSPHRCCQTC